MATTLTLLSTVFMLTSLLHLCFSSARKMQVINKAGVNVTLTDEDGEPHKVTKDQNITISVPDSPSIEISHGKTKHEFKAPLPFCFTDGRMDTMTHTLRDPFCFTDGTMDTMRIESGSSPFSVVFLVNEICWADAHSLGSVTSFVRYIERTWNKRYEVFMLPGDKLYASSAYGIWAFRNTGPDKSIIKITTMDTITSPRGITQTLGPEYTLIESSPLPSKEIVFGEIDHQIDGHRITITITMSRTGLEAKMFKLDISEEVQVHYLYLELKMTSHGLPYVSMEGLTDNGRKHWTAYLNRSF